MSKNWTHLNEFEKLDHDMLFEGKKFVAVTEAEPLTNHDTGEVLGTRITVEVTEDGTKYQYDGKDNVGCRCDVKIFGKDVKSYAWAGYRVPVTLVNVDKVVRWSQRDGGARNQLTVTGDVQKVKA